MERPLIYKAVTKYLSSVRMQDAEATAMEAPLLKTKITPHLTNESKVGWQSQDYKACLQLYEALRKQDIRAEFLGPHPNAKLFEVNIALDQPDLNAKATAFMSEFGRNIS